MEGDGGGGSLCGGSIRWHGGRAGGLYRAEGGDRAEEIGEVDADSERQSFRTAKRRGVSGDTTHGAEGDKAQGRERTRHTGVRGDQTHGAEGDKGRERTRHTGVRGDQTHEVRGDKTQGVSGNKRHGCIMSVGQEMDTAAEGYVKWTSGL